MKAPWFFAALLFVLLAASITLVLFEQTKPVPENRFDEAQRFPVNGNSKSSSPFPSLFPEPSPLSSAAEKARSGISVPDKQIEIEQILANQKTPPELAAERLISILQSLPPEQQVEAAGRISEFSSDEQAAAWAKVLIANKVPKPAAQALFDELLSRPHSILIPTLAEIADLPGHPQNANSTQILSLYYGAPDVPGMTWTNWAKEQLERDSAETSEP